jgi:hypothetical protein
MATLEELERRVTQLEAELACLLSLVASQGQPPEPVPPMIRDAWASQPALTAAAVKTLARMGITGLPPGHEELRQLMLASGINPEDNVLSREIIAMREE